MAAILVKIVTRYACPNDDKGTKQLIILVLLEIFSERDQACLPYFQNLQGGGLGMQGTSVIIGTRYAWNNDHNRNQVCVEHWKKQGPDMPGTLFDGDQTCLEHFKILKFVLYEPRSLLVQTDWTNKFTFSLRIF